MGISLERWDVLRDAGRARARRSVGCRLERVLTTVRPGRFRRRSGAAQRRTDLRDSDRALRHLLRLGTQEVVRGAPAKSNELAAACTAFSPCTDLADSVTFRDRRLETERSRHDAGGVRLVGVDVRTDGRAR